MFPAGSAAQKPELPLHPQPSEFPPGRQHMENGPLIDDLPLRNGDVP